MLRRACPPRYTALITMRLYTLPLLALFALGAQTASLPRHAVAVTDLEKKLIQVVEEVLKKDVQIENNSSEQELIEEVNAVPDIDNKLKKVPGIPVKIITDDVKPTLKKDYGIEKGDGIDDAVTNAAFNIKREEVDLKQPGEPQRQEHDTQSPEDTNLEQDTITAIKQSLAQTQNAFKQGFEGLATKFQDVFQTSEQLVTIQKSLENLQQSFSRQFEQINTNLQEYFSAKPVAESSPNKKESMQEMEKKIEVLGEKVEHEVKSLNTIVPKFTSVSGSPFTRQDSNNTTGSPSNPFNGYQEYINQFQVQITNYFNQFQDNIQNMFNQNQNPSQSSSSNESSSGSQADEATTQRPTIWGGIQNSFQNIFNRPPAQQQPIPGNAQADTPAAPSTAAPNRPVIQAIQNNPLYQGVVNLIRPQAATKAPVVATVITEQTQTAEKPAEPTAQAEGSNVVPDANKPVETKPEKDDKTPTQTVAPATGPIQQIVQRNPIVQGISSAVHRIQNSIGGNTEKPREIEIRGHKPGYGGAGDNNDDDRVVAAKSESIKEEQKEEQQTPQEPPKTEITEEKAPAEIQEVKSDDTSAKTEVVPVS